MSAMFFTSRLISDALSLRVHEHKDTFEAFVGLFLPLQHCPASPPGGRRNFKLGRRFRFCVEGGGRNLVH